MTTATMTTASLTAAIKESHAKSVSELWRHLGHKSAISGSQSKKIRALVPEANEMFAENKANKTPKITPETNQEVISETNEIVESHKTPTQNVTKGTKVGGYRQGSDYATIFAEGNKGFTNIDTFLSHVANILGKEKRLVKYSFYVVAPKSENAKSPSNRGTHMVNENGTFRIVNNEPVNA